MSYSNQSVKARCPTCKEITEHMPTTGTCPKCHTFSNNWFIYNEKEFFQHRRFNVIFLRVLILLSMLSLLSVIFFTTVPWTFWLLTFLLVPFVITERQYSRQIREKDKYNGHRIKDLMPWYYL